MSRDSSQKSYGTFKFFGWALSIICLQNDVCVTVKSFYCPDSIKNLNFSAGLYSSEDCIWAMSLINFCLFVGSYPWRNFIENWHIWGPKHRNIPFWEDGGFSLPNHNSFIPRNFWENPWFLARPPFTQIPDNM